MIEDGYIVLPQIRDDAETPAYIPFVRFDHGAGQVRLAQICGDPAEDRADYTHWERRENITAYLGIWRQYWEPTDLAVPAVRTRVTQTLTQVLNYSEDRTAFDRLCFEPTVDELYDALTTSVATYRERCRTLKLPQAGIDALKALDMRPAPLLFDQIRQMYVQLLEDGPYTHWVTLFRTEQGVDLPAILVALDLLEAQPVDSPAHTIHWLFQLSCYEAALSQHPRFS